LTLRATFYEKLNETLYSLNSNLRKEDFSISVDKFGASKFELRVAYNYDPEYYFRFSGATQQDGILVGKITRVPGPHLLEDSFDANTNLDTFFGYIKQWRSALEEELVSLPVKRQFEEQQRLLDSLLSQFQDLPEEYFTKAEAEDIRAKLDDFESRFTAHVNASHSDSAEKEKKLEQLHQEVEALKAQLDVLKKQGFFKRLYIRLSGIIGEDRAIAL
jgi:hypothetical protein